SSGIGAAAAQLFADEGANVVLGARRQTELNAQCTKITERDGTAVALAGDVTDEAYSKALVDLALDKFGCLDGAFNNAGILGELSSIPEMASSNWAEVLDTNLTSAFYAAKYQIPAMIENKKGSIVFTGSFVGYSNGGMPGMGAYAASKAGMVGLTLSLAAAHGPQNIRVNTLLPGGTKTAMAGDDPQAHAAIAELHGLKRMAEPQEIAQSALFLLSDRASFMTGNAVHVDGGASSHLG
ncbi:MAG: SDR family oxidoreductase, partial [Pseudomonadota bacterium]